MCGPGLDPGLRPGAWHLVAGRCFPCAYGEPESPTSPPTRPRSGARHGSMTIETARRASLEFVCVFGQDGHQPSRISFNVLSAGGSSACGVNSGGVNRGFPGDHSSRLSAFSSKYSGSVVTRRRSVIPGAKKPYSRRPMGWTSVPGGIRSDDPIILSRSSMVTGDGVRAGIARSLSVTASISNPCPSASRVCCSSVSTTRARSASSRPLPALLHGPEQIADLPVPVAESPGAVRIGHPERSHLVEYLAPNSVFNSLPRQRSSPHLRPDDRLVTIDRVLHHASFGVA